MTPVQLSLFIVASVVAAVVSIGILVYDLVFKYRDQVGRRLEEDFGGGGGGSSEQTRLFKDLSKLARQSEDEGEGLQETLERAIEQAGLSVTVGQVLVACAILASAAGAVAGFVTGAWWVVVAVVAATLPLPMLLVFVHQARRLAKLRQQLPDALEVMSHSISAGQTVSRAFQTVADDFEAPISDEFAWSAEQQNLGLPQNIALRDLARRSGVAELQMLVVALLVLRQTGGSPVKLLNNLASVVRKRIELQEKIKTLTAEGRMQAVVLLLLPPLLLAIITVLNPDYVGKLWDRPNLLAGLAVSEVIGLVWIRRIMSLEF